MKIKALLAGMLLCGTMAHAQNDPTIMTINGQPVSRSEFEYSYNKNNTDGVIDKKSVEEYVDLFVNYKLKVMAALDARIDTTQSFKNEFASYRNQLVRPTMVEESRVLAEAMKVYEDTKKQVGEKGLVRPAHILMRVGQKDSEEKRTEAKQRIDSIYNAIKAGANFEELAKKLSQDYGSASKGGLLPWIGPGQTLQEFEDNAFALKVGELSKPFLSTAGYHIILLKERKPFEPFDSLKTDILKFLEVRGVRDKVVYDMLDSMVAASNGKLTRDMILEQKAEEMEAKDPEMKNLIREYHDGLLLFEISNNTVWDKAAKDEEGLAAYFKKNKKKYKWESPRYKGIAYHVKTESDVKAVKNCVKNIPFDKWAETLRKTFNNDSIIRIRVEKGIFKEGDNNTIDRMVFGKKIDTVPVKDYPIDAVFGKKLTAPKEFNDVRGQVTSDYQDMLEKEWIASLRKKYEVVVNKDVLSTVNKH